MPTISQSPISELHEKITISLTPEEYKPAYQNELKKISKSVNMPGFRPGKTPIGLVEKIHGKNVFVEKCFKDAEKSLFDYLKEKNIDILYEPVLVNSNINVSENGVVDLSQSYFIDFEIGVFPKIDESILKNIKLDKYKVEISDAKAIERIKQYQQQFAKSNVVDSFNIEATAYLAVTVTNTTTNEKKENIYIGSKEIVPASVAKFNGLTKNQTIDFSLEDLDEKAREYFMNSLGNNTSFNKEGNDKWQITVTNIEEYINHDINDDLYNKVFKKDLQGITEEIFKADVKKQLEDDFQREAEFHLTHMFHHELPKHLSFTLPEKFLQQRLLTSHQNNQGKNPQDYTDKDWQDYYAAVRTSVFYYNIQKNQNIIVNQSEIVDTYKKRIQEQYPHFPINDEMMGFFMDELMKKNNNELQSLREETLARKASQYMLTQININEINITDEDFIKALDAHYREHHH